MSVTNQGPSAPKITQISDLDRLQQIKSSGGLLSQVDEQRLRRHQLWKLRRKWIQDQHLSPREPLHPPLTWLEKMRCREGMFWERNLKYKSVADMLYGPGFLKEFPKLMVYKAQRSIRKYVAFFLIPMVPFMAFLKMQMENHPDNIHQNNFIPVYPGEERFVAARKDVEMDFKTGQVRPKKGVEVVYEKK